MFDLPSAILLVGTAFLAALVGNLLVVALARIASEDEHGRGGKPSADQSGIVYFFDGNELVDCTAEAMLLLQSRAAGKAGGWRSVLSALAPRFPDLETAMKDLGEVGTVTLLSQQDQTGNAAPVALVATRHGGLTRIQLHDGTRENRSLAVDPISWRLLNEELDILRQITLRMKGPAWVEDATGQVTWANPAYLALLGRRDGEDWNIPWPLPSLFQAGQAVTGGEGSDTAPVGRVSIGINGKAHWFELRGNASASGLRTFFAEPIDALHQAETALRDFVQTLSKTFSQLPTGLAVFDRNRMLHMFNPALAQLTGLSVEFLAARPRLSAVLDALREANRLPEPKNYQNWRRELIEMERAATSGVYEDVWNLADGLTYRVTGRPHPDGAIALLIEDITPEMQRSQRYHKDMALGRSVIDAIADPVAVFNSAGDLVMENPAFASFGMVGSGVTADEVTTAGQSANPGAVRHVRDIAETFGSLTAPTPFWRQLQEYVLTIGDREAWSSQLRLADGRLFEAQVKPLTGTATMVLFRTVAASAPKVQLTEAETGRMRA